MCCGVGEKYFLMVYLYFTIYIHSTCEYITMPGVLFNTWDYNALPRSTLQYLEDITIPGSILQYLGVRHNTQQYIIKPGVHSNTWEYITIPGVQTSVEYIIVRVGQYLKAWYLALQ